MTPSTKTTLKIIGIGVGVYFAFKIWDLFRKGQRIGQAVQNAATSTVRTPPNLLSTGMAVGGLGYDLVRGVGLRDSWNVFRGTLGGIWK